MRQRRKVAALISGLAIMAMIAAGGASAAASTRGGATARQLAAHKKHGPTEKDILPPLGSSKPVYGGTLKIVGSGDVDHLDTCCAYYTTTYELLRAISRQLVSYKSSDSAPAPTKVVPDMATFSISKSGLVYTFHIKKGVYWDTPTGKLQVTSQDEVLGLKRLCNPIAPAGPIQYWEGNIAGMPAYCSAFSKLKVPSSTAGQVVALRTFMATHQISGLKTPNSSTLEITLQHVASNFINIMAMPMSSPVPPEILNYVPSSIQEEEHFISDGPYTVTKYTPNVGFTLARNPYWSQKTDDLRHQYFKAITVTEGENPTSIQEQLQTGDADLEWDTTVPPASVESLTHTKQFVAAFFGGSTYLVFNMQSKADGGALAKPAVRKALQYCVNKRHLIQVSGGPVINAAATEVLPPQITGYAGIDPYATKNEAGSSSKCKAMLKKAGYPHGLTLTLAYANNPPMPAQAEALQSDFAKGGVKIKFNEQPSQGEYFNYIADVSNRKHWDLAFGAWFPDWDGNGAQSFFGPLLAGSVANESVTYNYGGYDVAAVNSGINKALRSPTISAAAKDWGAVDKYVMEKDPAWVPLLWQALPQYIGKYVEHAEFNGFLGYVDITNLWVKKH